MLCQRVDLTLLFPSFASWLLLQLLHVPSLLSQTLNRSLTGYYTFPSSSLPSHFLSFPFSFLWSVQFDFFLCLAQHRHAVARAQAAEWKKGMEAGKRNNLPEAQAKEEAGFLSFSLLLAGVFCASLHALLLLFPSLSDSLQTQKHAIDNWPPAIAARPSHLQFCRCERFFSQPLTHSSTHPHILTLLLVGRLLPTNCL